MPDHWYYRVIAPLIKHRSKPVPDRKLARKDDQINTLAYKLNRMGNCIYKSPHLKKVSVIQWKDATTPSTEISRPNAPF
jgi:hypothetical protein